MKTLQVYHGRKEATTPAGQPVLRVFADGRKRLRFDAAVIVVEDQRKATPVKDAAGNVIDYRDVRIAGYLSTFANVTPSDRQGDAVQRGAFNETIPSFMRNPVMLVNHDNDVRALVGSFTTVKEDEKGLFVEGQISNSPAEFVKDIRFKVAEGHLKTMSMGGVFHYAEDDRTIFRVTLWEGSLTPIPANPDAMFSVRELSDAEVKKVQWELDAKASKPGGSSRKA